MKYKRAIQVIERPFILKTNQLPSTSFAHKHTASTATYDAGKRKYIAIINSAH